MKPKKITYEPTTTHMYRYSPVHTGIAPEGSTMGKGYELAWKTEPLNIRKYSASKSTPVVTGDYVFVGTDRTTLVALSRGTGEVLWEFAPDISERHQKGIHGSPATDGQFVYIGTYGGWVYSLNFEGQVRWKTRASKWVGSSPTIIGDELFIGGETTRNGEGSGFLLGLSKLTGKVIFKSKDLANYCHSTPTWEGDLVWMGDNSGRLSCWNVSHKGTEEEPIWEFNTGGDIKTTAAVYGDNVYITSWDKCLYSINKFKGTKNWEFCGYSYIMASPSVDPVNNNIIFADMLSYLFAVDIDTGKLKWKKKVGHPMQSSPTLLLQEGKGMIGTHDNSVVVFSLKDGHLVYQINTLEKVTNPPVIIDDSLFIFDFVGNTYCFIAKL